MRGRGGGTVVFNASLAIDFKYKTKLLFLSPVAEKKRGGVESTSTEETAGGLTDFETLFHSRDVNEYLARLFLMTQKASYDSTATGIEKKETVVGKTGKRKGR